MIHSTPKTILLYAGAGLASAMICWVGTKVLPGEQFISFYPGIVLGMTLLALGHVLTEIPRAKLWIAALLLPAFSTLGWRLAVYGYDLGGPFPRYVNAGAIGALFVAIGLLLAWRIQNRAVLLVCIVTAAGALGGAVFQLTEKVIHGDVYWWLILFAEWQVILMLGLALAMALVRPRAVGRRVEEEAPQPVSQAAALSPDPSPASGRGE